MAEFQWFESSFLELIKFWQERVGHGWGWREIYKESAIQWNFHPDVRNSRFVERRYRQTQNESTDVSKFCITTSKSVRRHPLLDLRMATMQEHQFYGR